MNKQGLSKMIAVVAAVVVVVGAASAYFFVLQPGAPGQQQAAPAPAPKPAPAPAPQQPAPKPAPAPAPQQPAPAPAPAPAPQQPAPAPAPAPQQPAPAPAPAVDPAKAAALKTVVDAYVKAFQDKDIPKLMTYYVQQGTFAEWKGQAGAFAGKYDGFGNVRILFASVAGNTDNIKIVVNNYKADIVGDAATVTFQEENEGHGKLVGAFTMNIDVVQKWVYQGGKWLLQNDQYDFKVFKTELVAEGTVFPIQWRKLGDFSFWNDRVRNLFAP